ncbi:MAG: DNA repair protein RecN [Sphaerochaetaceae bacterium]
MLESLSIRHYALIDDAQIEFGPGLTVITGETGAGKSIILGALSLLLGDKAENDVIRSGCDSASVSATFSFVRPGNALLLALDGMGLSLEDGSLVLSRTLKANGRSTITIQGVAKTRAELAQVGALLVDVSAQRDHQSLFLPSKQRDVLDAYGKNGGNLSSFLRHWNVFQQLLRQKAELEAAMKDSSREADYLSYAISEIENATIKEGEDETVADEIRVASSYEQIHTHLETVCGLLNGMGEGEGAVLLLKDADKEMACASRLDPDLAELRSRLESASIECGDIAETIRERIGKMRYSQEKLDELQARLSLLQRLKKKYGPSLSEVMSFLESSRKKIDAGTHGAERLVETERRIKEEKGELDAFAAVISDERKKAAAKLSGEIETRLHELGMEKATFSIDVIHCDLSSTGSDDVSFSICANPGLESHHIADVASGGELSRILLALKATLEKDDEVGTLVFDEIDAGIGGAVAIAVGDQLKGLGASHQVIIITHLASIAAKADAHFVVSKDIEMGSSFTHIQPVDGETRVKEIARMLSGDSASEISLEHARQLLRNSGHSPSF